MLICNRFTVHADENYFCNATSQKMARLIALSRLKPSYRSIPQFSKSEIEIIKLMCEEYTSKQIGAMLGYTTRTVENYREKIQEKIGAKNAIGVVIYAIKHQIYQPWFLSLYFACHPERREGPATQNPTTFRPIIYRVNTGVFI